MVKGVDITGWLALRAVGALFVLALLVGCAGPQKFVAQGERYCAQGQWDRCVRFFQKAHQEAPEDQEIKLLLQKAKWNASQAHMRRGEKLLKEKRYDEAVSEFQMSIAYFAGNKKATTMIQRARDQRESDYQLKLGKDFLRLKKYRKAKEAFLRALELNPQNIEAKEALARFRAKKAKKLPFKMKLKSETPISLKFKHTPLSNVFEVLTRLTGINFIFDKDVQDTRVTLFMTDVRFERFLEILLKTNKLVGKPVDEKTIVIYPSTPAKIKEYQDLMVRTFYLSHLNVKKAVSLLAKILKAKDIIANEKANSVVIRGSKEVIELASKIIEANDVAPAEVLINVEILEVSRSKERQLGLELNPAAVTLGIGESAPTVSSGSTFADMVSVYALDRLSNKELLLSLPTATLNLLKQDADTKTLANPQIRVKNGEKAKIHVGERVPLRVNRRVETTGVVTVDYQYHDIGIKLDVEPNINIHDEITLKLSVEVSALGPNLGTVDEPQFAIRTRKATSNLTLRDGEPVIIAGLLSDEERKTVRKIPLLGDIPGVGHLFSNLDSNDVKTDLLMTITPIIIRTQEIPGREVTQIWSGREREFSLEEPFESYAQRRAMYLDYPKTSIKPKMTKTLQERGSKTSSGTHKVKGPYSTIKARSLSQVEVSPKYPGSKGTGAPA
ncbi:MAG TPA: tetratricopeptide repeat protein, partial [Desulfobacterales bacterium]|nr:tetratricopeptide repeat protein [Desulfobacterales bacterium]